MGTNIKKAYKGLSWRLRYPDGTVLATAVGPKALFKTAKIMFNFESIEGAEDSDKFFYLYGSDGKMCATVSTKAASRKEDGKRNLKSKVSE